LSITGEHVKYFAGLFNSTAGEFVFKRLYVGGGFGKSGHRYGRVYVVQVTVPPVSTDPTAVQRIEELVDCVTEQKKQGADTSLLEEEIDQLIYKLYGFNDEEITYIEKYFDTQNVKRCDNKKEAQ